ncbi:MAG: nitroreductase family protein [Caldicoprobacter oshimai]|uniref:Nitroreductase n=1 Tax=Caldicoprobacter faecalis TaxID=937334 RepID=A0A1I5SZL5_9FIRM|nr:nitroreductase family protein [Caldicoprobacter faecalis]PZN10999.1 MAG: nitroreductase [Caldicoprobacter oshimai]SFP76213.1 Nitroreductase [Caldicoprobacter faecalis]
MDFLQLAKNRYSCRSYKKVPVEKEKLEQVLEAGRIAPSACNLQPFYFVVVTDEDLKQKVASSYRGQWIKDAPAIIVACGDHSKSWKRADGKDHCDIDVAIAVDHMTLAAAELGLGTCWVCAFDAAKCREVLNLPAHIEPVVLLPIGYPADKGNPDRHQAQRKKLDDIVRWNGFQGA